MGNSDKEIFDYNRTGENADGVHQRYQPKNFLFYYINTVEFDLFVLHSNQTPFITVFEVSVHQRFLLGLYGSKYTSPVGIFTLVPGM